MMNPIIYSQCIDFYEKSWKIMIDDLMKDPKLLKRKSTENMNFFQHYILTKFWNNDLNLKKELKYSKLHKNVVIIFFLFSLFRWLGEPVKCLILQTSFFLVNKKGYPVLPRALQNMVRQFYPLRVQFIIEGKGGFYEPWVQLLPTYLSTCYLY